MTQLVALVALLALVANAMVAATAATVARSVTATGAVTTRSSADNRASLLALAGEMPNAVTLVASSSRHGSVQANGRENIPESVNAIDMIWSA